MKGKRTYIYHITGSAIFLLLPLLLSPRPPHLPLFSFDRPLQRDFLANVCMLAFFYLNYYGLIPAFYFRRRYVWYGLVVVFAFLLVIFLPSLLTGRVPWETLPNGRSEPFTVPNDSFLQEIQHNIVLFAALVLFSLLLRVQERLLNIEITKQYDEIVHLKAQMNPHFLFNTLNGIYALAIREKASLTATTMLKLSGIMRYVVTESSDTWVSLEKELNYITDYIDLQKMRLPQRTQLMYSVTGTAVTQKIAPHNLMPFIENAFKYGVNPDEDSSIHITINVENGQLRLNVTNTKVHLGNSIHVKSRKGIANTRARLQWLYPGKHFLLLTEDDKYYRVQLTIDLR